MGKLVVKNYGDSRSPGVYELGDFALPRRTFFSTAVPAFLGTLKSPVQSIAEEQVPVPRMISLWSHFKQHIGEPSSSSRLASSVRGFFENGGHWCYVVVLKDQSADILEAGLTAIADLNTVDLVCAPDLSDDKEQAVEQQQQIVNHCDLMGDRFAILDSRPGDGLEDVWRQWSKIDGTNGALYYPWIKVRSASGTIELVPACGHIAGIFCRTDHSRGVHKAPANEPLEGAIDLERPLNAHEQAFLNPKGINCIRSFAGRGIRLWGARTLSNQSDWTYINVRRLFLTTVRWIDWHTKDLVFEPNDAKLWSRIERRLSEYLAGQYRVGALKGASTKEAFFVKCDAETNPVEKRDLGEVVTEVGMAPATPYEFILVRLILGSRGTHLSSFATS